MAQHNPEVDTLSSRNSRERILDAARGLFEARGHAGVSMAEIAAAAGVSRQAVYLHFADRAALMLALVEHVDQSRSLASELRKLWEAPDAITALRGGVSLQARLNPQIWAVARALDAVRRTDEAAEKGWQDRLQRRLESCRRLAARLEREGKLKPGLDPASAADLLWTITSLRMWEDHVLDRGWSAKRYEKHVRALVLAGLTKG